MSILRWGSRMLERSSPAALLIGGAALALTVPTVRRGLRATAVLATRGVLTVADRVRDLGTTVQDTAESLVAEAREPMPARATIRDRWDTFRERAKRRHHHLAVAAAGGYLAAKERVDSLRDTMEDIVEEARQEDNAANLQDSADRGEAEHDAEPVRDGLEAAPADGGKPPKKSRSRKE